MNVLLFAQVFLYLLCLRVLLETLRLRRLLALLEAGRGMAPSGEKIEAIIAFSDFFIHRVFRSANPCMLRSLLLYRYLRAMGLELRIAFGVRDEQDALKGHAWLLRGDRFLFEREDPGKAYQVMFVYP